MRADLETRVLAYLRARTIGELEEGHLDSGEAFDAEIALAASDDESLSMDQRIAPMLDFLSQFEEC